MLEFSPTEYIGKQLFIEKQQFACLDRQQFYFVLHQELQQVLSLEELINLWQEAQSANSKQDQGRGYLLRKKLTNNLNVVIRPNRRGGLVRYLLSNQYVLMPGSLKHELRTPRELFITALLYCSDINVPRVLAAGVRFLPGKLFYQAMLITEELEHFYNLLELKQSTNASQFNHYCMLAGQEAKKIILAGVFHPDLHLGNVLYNLSSEQVAIIDFDRASFFNNTQTTNKKLEHKIIKRWRDSVTRHKLDNSALESFIKGFSA